MLTFALIHCPHDEVASEVRQSDSSTETSTAGESVTTTETYIDSTYKIGASTSEKSQRPPPDGQYAMRAQWDDGPHHVASFFCKANYGVGISTGISSNAMTTVTSLFFMGPARIQ